MNHKQTQFETKEELIVRVIELQGSYHQIGMVQGNELLANATDGFWYQLHDLTRQCNTGTAKSALMSFSPKLYDELQGMADGLGKDLDSVIQLFSGFDVAFPQMGCTALIHRRYYIRNYDFSPTMYDARLVIMKPQNGYASVGFSQQIIGRLDGMNEKGLVVGLHFVNYGPRKEGFLATTIVRMVLEECSSTNEAIALIERLPHGYSYNYSLIDRNGTTAIVEVSPDKQIVRYDDPAICVNHFESEQLLSYNRKQIHGSTQRKKYLTKLLEHPSSSQNDMIDFYRHFNQEDSLLFFQQYQEFFGTLHTVVYSPGDLRVMVGIGGNCEPVSFSLHEYLSGKAQLPTELVGYIRNL